MTIKSVIRGVWCVVYPMTWYLTKHNKYCDENKTNMVCSLLRGKTSNKYSSAVTLGLKYVESTKCLPLENDFYLFHH